MLSPIMDFFFFFGSVEISILTAYTKDRKANLFLAYR